MRCIDLAGNIIDWKIKGCLLHKGMARQVRSSYHLVARKMLSELYPTMQIFEEVPIQINPHQILFLDFYIPIKNLSVEVHGEQHYKFVKLFHINRKGFMTQTLHDKMKTDWLDINNIQLVVLKYNELSRWKEQLT